KPSARLSALKNSLTSISMHRKLEPALLTRMVRGELDWIVMKALDKDRSRRYATANDLARDIERYLQGEAVEACPPSAWYKVRKFARKNRKLLGAASAFVLLFTAGILCLLAVSLWYNSKLQAALAQREAEQGRAEANLQIAMNVLQAVVGDRDLVQRDIEPGRQQHLQETLAF